MRTAFDLPAVDQPKSYDEVLTRLKAAQAQEQAQAVQEAATQAEAAQSAPTQATVVYDEPDDWYKAFIYDHESGNNPGAINASSGACGLGQALPCSKMPCSLSDYACQDQFFTSYMLGRYGSWHAAYDFWTAHQWW